MRTGSLCVVILAAVATAASGASRDGRGAFDTRQAFDALMAGQGTKCLTASNDGNYAWGESYVMNALVVMHLATGDARYLDRLIEHADAVLANRDSRLGRKDYLGRSLPGWSASGTYSIGEIELRDAHGRPTLYLRSSMTGYNHQTRVTVTAGAAPGTFDLHIVNRKYKREDRFTNLTMDPASANYAVPRIMASKLAQPFSYMRLFAKALGEHARGSARNPAPIDATMAGQRFLWPVHQGMILEPMTQFARVVLASPELKANARYAAKAREYIEAAEANVRSLEEGWRENAKGEGWYAVPKGAPIWMDGCDEPHNHYLAVGSALVHLAAATGKASHRQRVTQMARTIRNDMEWVAGKNAYVWPYWWRKGAVYNGWGPKDGVSRNTPGKKPTRSVEDFSHGSIDVNFAVLCYRDGIVFTRQDMTRLANTFTKNVVRRKQDGSLTFAGRVDGGAPIGRYDRHGPCWVLLAEFDPTILDVFREMRKDSPWSGYALWMLQSANMNWIRTRLAAGR